MSDQPEPKPIAGGLWNDAVPNNGYPSVDLYLNHILEQYKLYVEMADRISARRDTANTFFFTLHSTIIAACGYILEKGFVITKHILIIPLLCASFLCFVWWRLIMSYRQLNTAKYKVVGELEKRLPASPYWSAEWKALGEGKNRKLYVPLSHIENWVPVIFGTIYVIAVICSLCWW